GCSGLTSIEIPNSVTSIGSSAFAGCTGLTAIKVSWKRPLSVTADAVFDEVDKAKCTLYVPKGTEMLYWVAPVWSEFTNIVEYDEPEDVSYYITINGLEGGEIMQKVDIGKTYSYKFNPYEEWEINSVTFNGEDVTSQLHDGIYSTPAISGNSTLSVVYKKGASGVKSVADDSNVKVFASSRAISIAGATAKSNVSIYSTDGKLLKSAHGNARFTMDNTGVYIVKVDNEVFKVSL
ncbi:MAG: leucine-rich repeat protein, partial [Prevotella sp.]|nr:leucine-rich repeat protein [Prevotella sp.]